MTVLQSELDFRKGIMLALQNMDIQGVRWTTRRLGFLMNGLTLMSSEQVQTRKLIRHKSRSLWIIPPAFVDQERLLSSGRSPRTLNENGSKTAIISLGKYLILDLEQETCKKSPNFLQGQKIRTYSQWRMLKQSVQ